MASQNTGPLDKCCAWTHPTHNKSGETLPANQDAITPQSASVSRHGNFKEIEAKRPKFNPEPSINIVQSPDPGWTYGQGVSSIPPSILQKPHTEIDPYAPDRPMMSNYKLLISGIAPRPISFISTVSADGKTQNLSPFSYFQVVDHDPPIFIVAFSSRPGAPKDTYRNLKETGECVINTVSETMMPAVNATAMDAPYGISEWQIAGLHPVRSTTVKPPRVQESVFSIEGKLIDMKEFGEFKKEGMSIAAVAFIKATRFWIREDAIDETGSKIDLGVLRPIAQLGGISYGRVVELFELPRKTWEGAVKEKGCIAELEKD